MNRQFEIGDVSPPKLFLAVAALLGLLFALITEPAVNLLAHIIQWQIQTTGPVIVILAIHLVLFRSSFFISRPWVRVFLAGLLGAIAFSPIALLSDIYLGGENVNNGVLAELFDEMASILPPITLAWLVMNLPWLMGYRVFQSSLPKEKSRETEEKSAAQAVLDEPEFLGLTSLSSARDILYIKSELQYLKVVTADNKQLILLSLKEAITQLDAVGVDGVQCHRGYWVASTAISSAQRSGRQAVFILLNGEEVPISRSNVQKCLALAGEAASHD